MNWTTLTIIALGLAALPAGLFLINLLVYRPIHRSSRRKEALTSTPHSALRTPIFQNEPPYVGSYRVSVLIPARNEESNIRATLEAVLTNEDAAFEVIVLDDHSTDRTAAIVGEFAQRDGRIRLETAPPLPAGWCGKQHACHVLAKLARHPLLVFMDADVRLAPDALARMRGFMWRQASLPAVEPGILPGGSRRTQHESAKEYPNASKASAPDPGGRMPPSTAGKDACRYTALASGVPRQELGTFSERLLIPQIHFILLGFLPMHFMRWTGSPAFSAGCGQLFIARRDAYVQTGGHALIRQTLHDGVKLPRLFRRAGFRTELFDATDLATCRMYRTNAETWRGLGKNATEGLAAPATILPMTALLLGGQVLPFVLLAFAARLTPTELGCASLAAALAYAPRLLAAWRFRQPWGGALLHPLGVSALLLIQWHALLRHLAGKPSVWKGRSYSAAAAEPVEAA